MTEIDLGGLLFPPLLISALVAIPITSVCTRLLDRFGLYRWLWHRHLFNAALYLLLTLLTNWIPLSLR